MGGEVFFGLVYWRFFTVGCGGWPLLVGFPLDFVVAASGRSNGASSRKRKSA
jgi:hypothetical protein